MMIAAQVRKFSCYKRHLRNHNLKARCFTISNKLKVRDGVYGNDGSHFADNFVEDRFWVKDLTSSKKRLALKSQAHPGCLFGGGSCRGSWPWRYIQIILDFKNYVKIMSKSPGRYLVRLQGQLKLTENLHIQKCLLYISMFVCSSHQPQWLI